MGTCVQTGCHDPVLNDASSLPPSLPPSLPISQRPAAAYTRQSDNVLPAISAVIAPQFIASGLPHRHRLHQPPVDHSHCCYCASTPSTIRRPPPSCLVVRLTPLDHSLNTRRPLSSCLAVLPPHVDDPSTSIQLFGSELNFLGHSSTAR